MAAKNLPSQLEASWAFVVNSEAAGCLELRSSTWGFSWRWADKPHQLVDLLGVESRSSLIPWYFGDLDAAVEHLMKSTASAFGGRCALVSADGAYAPNVPQDAANDPRIGPG